MASAASAQWSTVSADIRIGRRTLLALSASAAAALLLSASPHLRLSPTAGPAAEFVQSLPKRRWGWAVELAVLERLDADRPGALALLWSALELDLDPVQRRQRRPALRLYDLYAAASGADGRLALSRLVMDRSAEPDLLSRARRWAEAAPMRARLWRTTAPDGRALGIVLRAA